MILFVIFLYSYCYAQPQKYGYKYSKNGDIVSDIFLIQNGNLLDSVNNSITHITYKYEYDRNKKLKRDINYYQLMKILYVNGRAVIKYLPGTRDYYYNENWAIDSIGYGHFDNSTWVNDSSGYKYNYSPNGKVISKIYSTKDTVKEFENYIYDSIGNVILDKIIYPLDMDTSITRRKYDQFNRLVLKTKYISGSPTTQQSESVYLYRYDSTGNVNCRVKFIVSDDTLLGGYNYYLKFDNSGKLVYELFSSGLNADSTWGSNNDITFKYDTNNNILKMGDVVWFDYNADNNIDTLVNVHSVDCGYLGNTATLLDSYGNIITLPNCAGYNYFYYVSKITEINKNEIIKPSFLLYQNYPNPFNPTTTISFYIPYKTTVSLKIYDILGKEVAALVNGETLTVGKHSKQWNGSGFASGIYFYRLSVGGRILTKKLLLLK